MIPARFTTVCMIMTRFVFEFVSKYIHMRILDGLLEMVLMYTVYLCFEYIR